VSGGLEAFLATLAFITVAELGDKTQLLTLSFATRYPAWKVLLGVLLGSMGVHLLAVVVGQAISGLVPMRYIQLGVGAAFIGFALWTLASDGDEEDEEAAAQRGRGWGIVLSIAGAFFLAELGDKTQLAAMSLAARYGRFWSVWLGAVGGMVLADGLAVAIGAWAGKKIPRKAIKYVSAAVFALFGVLTLVQALTGGAG
jgi:putative Ca2+/H+ antiporter (TMEM165/GDT1 family)